MKRSIKFKVQIKQNSHIEGLRLVSLDITAPEQQLAFISQLSEMGVYPGLASYLKEHLQHALVDYEKGAKEFLMQAASHRVPESDTDH